MKWCRDNQCDVGDRELSQAFIHRAIKFLRPGGTAALLVSTGVFFKHHRKSQAFRQQWLTSCRINHVVNFSAVRHLYFKEGIAPFTSVVFSKETDNDSHVIEYWSAKATLQATQMRAVVLSLADRRLIPQYEATNNDRIWKVFWWGNHHDYALVRQLEAHDSLEKIVGLDSFARGFEKASQRYDSDWLNEFEVFPVVSFRRYGPLPRQQFQPVPSRVHRRGQREFYEGRRLLVRQGITRRGGHNGLIEARLETEPFAFTNSIHCVKTDGLMEWQSVMLLAIFWSSVARYYLWMTSGAWGMWHDQLHLNDVERMPIAFPTEKAVRKRITEIVERLRGASRIDPQLKLSRSSGATVSQSEIETLEQELDDLVFDCYGLGSMQRDLIRNMCTLGLSLYYKKARSDAVQPLVFPDTFVAGKVSDLSSCQQRNDMFDYVKTLGELWNQELGDDGEFAWHVVRPQQWSPMIAVMLETIPIGQQAATISGDDHDWSSVLQRLDESSVQHMGSRRLYVDGMVRVVGETDVLLIKRNERRLWTASMAREDAEATIKQAMQLQESL